VRQIYTGLLFFLLPLVLLRLYWKGRRVPGYRQRWRERLGVYGGPAKSGVIWLHAVSVGEAEAAFPVIKRLAARFPSNPVLVTCTTPTASARIQAEFGETVHHVYLPYDLPFCINRFLKHFQPRIGIIMETEIWPNLFYACSQGRIPLAMINGRLSEKSARGYRRVLGLTRESLDALAFLQVQTRADADRYISVGANPDSIEVTGNAKFDIGFPEDQWHRAQNFRKTVLGQRPAWIAGSTHPGEEDLILSAFIEIRRQIPNALLILAPRHPERAADIRKLVVISGQVPGLRTETVRVPDDVHVLILNTLGELRWIYGAADLAFVGGSLVPRGGHNLLEPAAAGVPVLFGPHMFNFSEITAGLTRAGGGLLVNDAAELAERVCQLLPDRQARQTMGDAGRAFLAANRGAVQRMTEAIVSLVEKRL
jgi:3-deoxy-D-manno-octulosonic-acid transferase